MLKIMLACASQHYTISSCLLSPVYHAMAIVGVVGPHCITHGCDLTSVKNPEKRVAALGLPLVSLWST